MLEGFHEESLGIVEFCEVGGNFLEVLHEETLGIVEFYEVGRTLHEVLHEETLGIFDFHEVGRTFLEVLHEETLGIAEFHEVGKNSLGVLHKVLIVVVLYEVSILYLQVHSNLLRFRYLHEVVRKLPPRLRAVILHCRYFSDVLPFYFLFHFCVPFYFIAYFSKEGPYVPYALGDIL